MCSVMCVIALTSEVNLCFLFDSFVCLSSWFVPPRVTSQCVTSPQPRADQHSEQHTHTLTHTDTHTQWKRLSMLIPKLPIANIYRPYNINRPMCGVMTDEY